MSQGSGPGFRPASGRSEAPAPLLANVLLFGRVLRRAGLPVSLGQMLTFLEALEWVGITDRQHFFHTARSLLVYRREDLSLFEAIFLKFWRSEHPLDSPRGQKAPRAPRHDLKPVPFTIANYLAHKARLFDPEIEVTDRSGSFSDQEVLQRKEFSRMSEEELAEVRRLLSQLRWKLSQRRTRRWVSARRGRRVDFRKTLRQASQWGGVALSVPRRGPKVKQRPLVLLADISGSMEKYSRLVLQFFYCVSQSLGQVESFVFGTRLSRITPQLALRNIDRALEEAALEVVDWSGGTRIGESLESFNRQWSRRVLRRGAVVIVVSDGWDRGESAELGAAMRFLQHRCHRLIWLNPHLGKSSYQPLVEGMQAALPYVDDFLPVHNFHSLEQLAERLQDLPRRR
ncbi:MAG: VWA domain-containing protein [Deltaproteobacteria bacterium]|nr:VWA domain-containing protein [Deltaproteobacteria bacterium]